MRKSVLYLFILSPLLLFSQDTTINKVKGIEINSSSNLLFFPLVSRPQLFIATGLYYCGKKNDLGISYFATLLPKFDDNDKIYGVDSGYGFADRGIKLTYRRVIAEDRKFKNRFMFQCGIAYLWGKLSYDNLRSPGRALYPIKNRGVILSSGMFWYRRITGPIWFTSVMDGGIRLVSMQKNELSLADSRKFFNYYMGAGLAFRF